MKKFRLLSAAAAVLTAVCLTSCGHDDEGSEALLSSSAEEQQTSTRTEETSADTTEAETASLPETTETVQEETEAETETTSEEKGQGVNGSYEDVHTIAPGLWLATSDFYIDGINLRQQFFYEVNAEGTGVMAVQSTGEREEVTYTFTDTEATVEVVAPMYGDEKAGFSGTPNYINADTAEVVYSDGSSTLWRYFSDQKLDDIHFFSNMELYDLAESFYNSTDGRECQSIRVYIGEDDMIILELFEAPEPGEVGDENYLDTYRIDRFTGKGTDKNGEEVDLVASMSQW
ncbi:MAG: hypothetical protein IKQ90_08655 [Ruminococcus sp.]|nr:hypothetical protein [Ruminococcus sp.]